MDYNPFLPEVQHNPYPYYAHLREHAPVYQVPGVGFWAISRYDDVFHVLKSPQVFSNAIIGAAVLGDLDYFPPDAPALLGSDPPYHTRLRKLANRAFTPRRIASLESHIRAVTQQLLQGVAPHGTFDLIRELAAPLPTIAIAELLGVPPEQRDNFRRWIDDVVRAINGSGILPEEREQVRQSMAELRAYLQTAIAAYHKQPGDNLLSDLVRAEEEEQRLTDDEILSLALILFPAGSETTRNLIGNTMLALLNHPEQLAQVRANRALIPRVIEEVLRYDSPVQTMPRLAPQEVQLSGTTIPAGSVMLLLFGSANHDERKFAEPERFDITRNIEEHIAFGFGIHFCLGAQLARLEGKVALEVLLEQFPRLACTEEHIPRVESLIVRGVKTLPLMVQ